MQDRVVKPAVLSLLEAGPEQLEFGKREFSEWAQQAGRSFYSAWANEFFPWLWRAAERTDEESTTRREWLNVLRGHGEKILDDAIRRYPRRDGRSYRAQVRAEGLFFGSLFKVFPQLKEAQHDAESHG